jgi:predicted Fe-S protein YdhL (DUF1289 family)
MSTPVEPASPCIDICVLDEQDICAGCYRSAQEITDWSQLDYRGKQRILDQSRERRKQDGQLL